MKKPIVDKDLTQLLRHCDSNDLESIVNIILASPSQTLSVQQEYRTHQGDHKRYVDEIVYEITSFGGNSLANIVRGQGVPYADMVRDVATKLGVRPSMDDTTPRLEEKIILRIIRLAYDKLSEEDRLALQDILSVGSDGTSSSNGIDATTDGGAGNGTLVDNLDFSNGFPEEEISRRLATAGTSLLGDRIHNAIQIAARSARFRQTINSVVKAGLAKLAAVGLGGPVSWTMAAGQALYDLFGPNYTVAIGLIAQIGLIRQKYAQIQRDMVDEEIEAGMVS